MGHLEGHRAGDLDARRPAARVLELRVGGYQRQVGADAAVEAIDRRQVEPLALDVEVAPALFETHPQRPLMAVAPDLAAEARPRRPESDREERVPRLDHG